jgi:hypothetical protein
VLGLIWNIGQVPSRNFNWLPFTSPLVSLSGTSKFQKLVFSAIKIPPNRWHSRFDYPSRDIIHRGILKNNLPCAQFDSSSESMCGACAYVKAHLLPYLVSSRTFSPPLELIHLDV